MKKAEKIILLGMSDLGRLDRARAVRIHSIHKALQARAPVTLLAGNRMTRRWNILRYLLYGGFHDVRALYVEASTSTATAIDLLLMALASRRNIPVLIYIPDAYQLFPDLYPRVGWKVNLLDFGWRQSIRAYQQLADVLLFPSRGLAACFDTEKAVKLLPPAGLSNRELVPLAWDLPKIVYVGGTSHRYGSDLLLSAMNLVVAQYPAVKCQFVTSDMTAITEHPSRHAPWLAVEHCMFDELQKLIRFATIAISPLRVNLYNDLAIPVKLFDYMSFGRPLIVTACRDMARLVNDLKAGLVVEDSVQGLAEGILRLLDNPRLATRLGRNGYEAIQIAHSWSHRADRLLKIIYELEQQKKR